MNNMVTRNGYGTVIEPATLKIQRWLPGTVDRVWAYLTDSDLRRQWLAAGAMELQPQAPFEFVWRNDELSDPPGKRPDGFGAEHRLQSRVLEVDPPRHLVIAWEQGEVSFDLEQRGDEVLLTLIHRRVSTHEALLNVSAGWHAHLDVLLARMTGTNVASFWDSWSRLREDYAKRLAE